MSWSPDVIAMSHDDEQAAQFLMSLKTFCHPPIGHLLQELPNIIRLPEQHSQLAQQVENNSLHPSVTLSQFKLFDDYIEKTYGISTTNSDATAGAAVQEMNNLDPLLNETSISSSGGLSSSAIRPKISRRKQGSELKPVNYNPNAIRYHPYPTNVDGIVTTVNELSPTSSIQDAIPKKSRRKQGSELKPVNYNHNAIRYHPYPTNVDGIVTTANESSPTSSIQEAILLRERAIEEARQFAKIYRAGGGEALNLTNHGRGANGDGATVRDETKRATGSVLVDAIPKELQRIIKEAGLPFDPAAKDINKEEVIELLNQYISLKLEGGQEKSGSGMADNEVQKLATEAARLAMLPQGPISCDECGKLVSSLQNLKLHKRGVHEKHFEYRCTYCTKGFRQARDIRGHLSNNHGFIKEFKCTLCDEEFGYSRNLKAHLEGIHKMKPLKSEPE